MSASGTQPAEGPLTAEEQQFLEQAGIFRGTPSGGKRKQFFRLSVKLIIRVYERFFASQGFRQSYLIYQGIELPVYQESVAALEFMGFAQATAEEIYQRWESRPEHYPYSFLDHAAGQFQSRSQGDLSHAEFMAKVGLKQEFQEAILDPRFASIFETETLKVWIQDTLASRYQTIGYLQQRCRNMASRGGGSKGHQKKESRPSLPTDLSVFDRGQGGPSNVPAQDPNEGDVMSMSSIAKDLEFPEDNVRIGPPAPALDDHDVLYKGCSAHTAENTPSLIGPDGSIDLTSLDTLPGGDFNARKLASYWTPEEATAELYRVYAARRDAYAETWIISIQVPKDLVVATLPLRKTSLWYSDDWKEYVWLCRKKSAQLPGKFDELSNAQFIQGHICCKLPQMIASIKPDNVQTTINEDFSLLYKDTSGQSARSTQWVLIGDDTMVQLSKAVRGKLHIDIHASSMHEAK